MTDTPQAAPASQRWVRMRHASSPDEATTARMDAFQETWKARGWELVEEVTADGFPVLDPEAATADELRAELDRRGVTYPSKASKSDLAALLNPEVPSDG